MNIPFPVFRSFRRLSLLGTGCLLFLAGSAEGSLAHRLDDKILHGVLTHSESITDAFRTTDGSSQQNGFTVRHLFFDLSLTHKNLTEIRDQVARVLADRLEEEGFSIVGRSTPSPPAAVTLTYQWPGGTGSLTFLLVETQQGSPQGLFFLTEAAGR